MFSWRAEMMAARSRGFMAGSGWPILAATVISRASLPKSFDFWASWRPLRCMMFLNWEWPAMRGLFENRPELGWKRGLIGRQMGKIKDLRALSGLRQSVWRNIRHLLTMTSCPDEMIP